MRYFWILLFFFGAFLPLEAQILNIEKNLQEGDTATHYWTGAAQLAFTLNNRSATPDKQTKFLSLKTDVDVAYISGKHRYMLINQLEYRSLSGAAFIRTGYSHFRTSLNWREKVGWEFFGQLQYDIGRGLQSRALAGSGLRLRLIESDNFSLTFGPGLMYERERWAFPNSETDEERLRRLIKSTNYLSLAWKISPLANYRLITYYQTGYDDKDEVFRHRASFDTRLEFQLTSRLQFITSFVAAYENRPIVPIQLWIYELQNGLRYAF